MPPPWWGVFRSVVVPSPTCPESLLPQAHYAAPWEPIPDDGLPRFPRAGTPQTGAGERSVRPSRLLIGPDTGRAIERALAPRASESSCPPDYRTHYRARDSRVLKL